MSGLQNLAAEPRIVRAGKRRPANTQGASGSVVVEDDWEDADEEDGHETGTRAHVGDDSSVPSDDGGSGSGSVIVHRHH